MQRLKRFLPLLLSLCIVIADQASKIWVINNIPAGTLYREYFGDFLWIVHVRNTGAAFSLGAQSGNFFRIVILIILPILGMIALAWTSVTKKEILTKAQRWFVAGIVGGGIGTIIDRVFRFDEGVVDFISVKFYGLFGLDRWPTFNVSDSMVVIFVILFVLSVIFCDLKNRKNKEENNGKESRERP